MTIVAIAIAFMHPLGKAAFAVNVNSEAIVAVPHEVLEPVEISKAGLPNLPPSPNWSRYAYAEALIMGRDNQAFNRPLVVAVDPSTFAESPALSSQDLQFPYGGGFRTFYGYLGPDCRGWEIGYFGLYNLMASASVPPGDGIYAFPDNFGPDLAELGDTVTVTDTTTINSVEANMFHHFERWNVYRKAWLEVDWLTGFRYVGVEDKARIDLTCCGGLDTYAYRVGTRNNMFGGQIGGRARLNWQRWALEGWGKAAILGNAAEQYQDPVVSNEGIPLRDYGTSTTGTSAAMVADLNITAIYRLTKVWGIRAGFNT
ncbi:MAG: hypothetical protein ACKOYJ_03410, partial [Planctomycetia bacterium]